MFDTAESEKKEGSKESLSAVLNNIDEADLEAMLDSQENQSSLKSSKKRHLQEIS